MVYLAGLDLVEPGLVSTSQWRPDPGTPVVSEAEAVSYAAVAKVP
jgi:hypothetical protein